MVNLPEATRPAGLSRLATFVAQSLAHYFKSRNFDFGPERRSNVSLLSPYVRHRLLLEQELLEATLQHHSLSVADKFVQEVFWRTYFKGWLEHRPDVWADYRTNVAGLIKTLETDSDLLRRYTKAIEGKTGIECFDTWIAELQQTGYLHNHTRMWFASIWIFTLGLPWQLGADFFLRHLLDGDPASNTLSWRWVAGLHTKGKMYLALSSNIARYTDNRFDPSGQLAPKAQPQTESRVFPLRELPSADLAPDGRAYGLLITEEDASPETLDVNHKPRSVLGVLATTQRSPLPVGERVQQFATGAITDALRRATQHFAVDGQFARSSDWNNLLTDWAKHHDLKTIVTGYAPVGPVAEMLAATRQHLHEQGIDLLQIRRPYDSLAWPHAQRGYFKLKAKIPELLHSLGIETQEEKYVEQSEAV
ncbi:MAG: DNA photolyase [Gammaproteobacteria bacterium]|nr:DNA photolyase [Gammaproteobacteria bacterium]